MKKKRKKQFGRIRYSLVIVKLVVQDNCGNIFAVNNTIPTTNEYNKNRL